MTKSYHRNILIIFCSVISFRRLFIPKILPKIPKFSLAQEDQSPQQPQGFLAILMVQDAGLI